MNIIDTISTLKDLDAYVTALLNNPATSKWLKDALVTAVMRDVADVVNDAEDLAAIAKKRLALIMQQYEPINKTIWNSDGTDGPCLICAPPEDCPSRAISKALHEPLPHPHDAIPGTDPVQQFFQDIMTTAIEGGINDWAVADEILRDKDSNVISFYCRDYEERTAPWSFINAEKIEEALNKIVANDSTIKIGDTYLKDIAVAYSCLDAGSIDAMLADIIVQVAAFGEIVFG